MAPARLLVVAVLCAVAMELGEGSLDMAGPCACKLHMPLLIV